MPPREHWRHQDESLDDREKVVGGCMTDLQDPSSLLSFIFCIPLSTLSSFFFLSLSLHFYGSASAGASGMDWLLGLNWITIKISITHLLGTPLVTTRWNRGVDSPSSLTPLSLVFARGTLSLLRASRASPSGIMDFILTSLVPVHHGQNNTAEASHWQGGLALRFSAARNGETVPFCMALIVRRNMAALMMSIIGFAQDTALMISLYFLAIHQE